MVTCFPEIKVHQLKPNEDDFIIVACDGIWDCMESQEAVKFVYKENEKLKNPSSPSKRASLKGSSKKKESKSKHLGLIVEKMMDKNCPSDLQVTEGIGADNMTCIIVELNKRMQSGFQ
jgi:serine/threonine protein phosphatase PrpC